MKTTRTVEEIAAEIAEVRKRAEKNDDAFASHRVSLDHCRRMIPIFDSQLMYLEQELKQARGE